MTAVGHVQNGVVVFENPSVIPDGTRVFVVPAVEEPVQGKTLLEQFGDLVGSIDDLPADFALNHDHYIHGGPKK